MQIKAIGIQRCGKKVAKLKGQHSKNMVPAPQVPSGRAQKGRKKTNEESKREPRQKYTEKRRKHTDKQSTAQERETLGRKHMYKSCGANGSLEGCDFLSARILSTKSSHQPRGPLSFSLSETQTHRHTHNRTHQSSHSTTEHLSRIKDTKWWSLLLLLLLLSHSIHIQFIVYFVIHLTHITCHIEWRYIHHHFSTVIVMPIAYISSAFSSCIAHRNEDGKIYFVFFFFLFRFECMKIWTIELLKGDLMFGYGFRLISRFAAKTPNCLDFWPFDRHKRNKQWREKLNEK